ncbi:hypothetical protein [Streptomyces scabiei]|uniref:hypothetical protein n=1 Tax=Streptomyces scabiei TaxID=1930 RepID=UPI0038F7938A
MIDNLGFHTDRDYQAELDSLNRQINATTGRLQIGLFHSPEDERNTRSRLTTLQTHARILAREAAMENQRLDRLTAAVRVVGDPILGFIAYVVFGPQALPLEPLYEIRVLDTNGYTVPGTVRTNLPASRVESASQKVLNKEGRENARLWGERLSSYRVQVTPF